MGIVTEGPKQITYPPKTREWYNENQGSECCHSQAVELNITHHGVTILNHRIVRHMGGQQALSISVLLTRLNSVVDRKVRRSLST